MKNLIFFATFALATILFTSCEDGFLGLEDSGIFGVVIDAETGNPIPFATVFVNGPESQSTQSDANGNYRFDNLRTGNYVLSAEAHRYLTTFVNTTVYIGDFTQANIEMDFHSLLSTHVLNFGTEYDELEIVVTNLFDRPIDINTEEDENWLIANHFISGLEPGQSEIITVKVSRLFLDQGLYSVPLVVDVEEDFGFEVFESYVVTINVEE